MGFLTFHIWKLSESIRSKTGCFTVSTVLQASQRSGNEPSSLAGHANTAIFVTTAGK